MTRKPIGLTIPYREVGYKEKKEASRETLLAEVAVLTEMVRVLSDKVRELEAAKLKEKSI
jgi:hypothetical protein